MSNVFRRPFRIGGSPTFDEVTIDDGRLVLTGPGSSAEPAIEVGTGASGPWGLYGGSNELSIAFNNSYYWRFTTTELHAGTVGGADIERSPGAGNPIYTFYSDTDTGVARSAADTLDLVAGGTTRLKLDSSGAAVTGEITISGLTSSQSHPTNYKPVYVNTDTGELYRLA